MGPGLPATAGSRTAGKWCVVVAAGKTPPVSVIILVYNRTAAHSVLAQTFKDLEIIIVRRRIHREHLSCRGTVIDIEFTRVGHD